MTRRDRLEAKAARRRVLAKKAAGRSNAAFAATKRLADSIPLGQPILVGHHSERRARKDRDRIHAGMRRGVEEAGKADYHASTAAGLERQLDRSIYRDDPDAAERLREKIAGLEECAARDNAINRAWRAKDRTAAFAALGVSPEGVARIERDMAEMPSWVQRKGPMDATNTRATIRKEKARLAELEAQASAPPRKARSLAGTIDGFAAELSEEPDEDRVLLTFDLRLPKDTYRRVRSAGLLWSPSRNAFTRAGRNSWERAAALFRRGPAVTLYRLDLRLERPIPGRRWETIARDLTAAQAVARAGHLSPDRYQVVDGEGAVYRIEGAALVAGGRDGRLGGYGRPRRA